MAKLNVSAGGVDIADGAYEATLMELEVCEPTDRSPNKKPWLKWHFTVFDGSEDQELTGASSTALGPKSKARPWLEAILGRRLEPGEEIDTDTVCPKDCQVVLKNDPERGFTQVADVLPPRPRRQAPRSAGPDTGVSV